MITIKMNFTLDQTLYKKFKKHCVDIGESMAALLRQLIETRLREVQQKSLEWPTNIEPTKENIKFLGETNKKLSKIIDEFKHAE